MALSEHWDKVVEYIFDHEKDDFFENPSRTHVYYHAVAAQFGESEAEYALQCAIAHSEALYAVSCS